MGKFKACILIFIISITSIGCANIVPPEGGKKDIKPPKLLSVEPRDSTLNTRVTKIEMHFNEFLTVENTAAEVQISPLLPFPFTTINVGKRVTVRIPDSLLQENTTYRISFGNAIKDLHEGNVFAGYNYTFSTGNYFDSLQLSGKVYDAATGLPDTGSLILLYSASKSDSIVVREKPLYLGRVTTGGNFAVKGLPDREFRIYVLKDGNNNLTYDGGNEKIGFIGKTVFPSDSITEPIVFKLFREKSLDTIKVSKKESGSAIKRGKKEQADKSGFNYQVAVDTSDIKKRTMDITKPLTLTLSKHPDTINTKRMNLSYDSSGISVETAFSVDTDSVKREVMYIKSNWKENTVYTLRLLKGFVKDSSGIDAMPSKFIFRTKNDADYAKIQVNLPAKYNSSKYILMAVHDNDTVYNAPVTDTVVRLQKLQPGGYILRIIVDANGNGQWDTGDLFEKRQPEEVIPFSDVIMLKAGWDNITDFEPKKKEKPEASPKTRDKTKVN